ncbi:unnamed protein product [Orchesella dallaii]|uniref:Uncharacterized protein n=1 Tax=Orchesella dallaii TaxID=48710 RepID=A0ABP1RQM1_9HEXA
MNKTNKCGRNSRWNTCSDKRTSGVSGPTSTIPTSKRTCPPCTHCGGVGHTVDICWEPRPKHLPQAPAEDVPTPEQEPEEPSIIPVAGPAIHIRKYVMN